MVLIELNICITTFHGVGVRCCIIYYHKIVCYICSGDIVHVCPVCNKAFNREDSLEVHKQQHDKTSLLLPTIDNLDNLEEHYFEVVVFYNYFMK